MENAILIVIAVLLVIFVPILVKKHIWKKLGIVLENNDFDSYYKIIDSWPCKLTFSAFDRENMRLSGYISQNRKNDIEELIPMIANMRIKPKYKVVLGNRGFYYYLEQGRVKRARDMITLVKENGGEEAAHDLEMQYSILLKKESKYIDELKEKLERYWDGKKELTVELANAVGTMEYLIGLQYSYLNDHENMMKYFTPALEHCKGTPFEDSINEIIKQA